MGLFKNDRKIQFNITEEYEYIYDNYKPQPMSNFKHPWLRSGPPARCPGFADIYKHGYVIPMWFDLKIELEPAPTWEEKQVMLTANMAQKFCSWHDIQAANIMPHLAGHNFFHSILKLHSPWELRTPKGYSVLQISPWFNFDNLYEVTPGQLNSSYHHNVVIPLFLRLTKPVDQSSFINIRAGDPLCAILPIERKSFDIEITKGDKDISRANNYFKQAIALRKDAYRVYKELGEVKDPEPMKTVPSAKVYRDLDDEKNA